LAEILIPKSVFFFIPGMAFLSQSLDILAQIGEMADF
tara:strand:+ start:572 stop:682 length:111 start_codon:yes stop_codon:yes gene_type:complete